MQASKPEPDPQAPGPTVDPREIQGTSPAAPVIDCAGRWAQADLTERQARTPIPPPPEER